MGNLAILYLNQERHDEAEKLLLETVERQRRVLGADHPDTLYSMHALARVVVSQGRRGEAGAIYRKTLEAQKRVLGADHPDTLGTLYDLACNDAMSGRQPAALNWLRQAVDGGWTDAVLLAGDSDLASLHGDPEFEDLLAVVKKRAVESPAN